MINGQLWPYVLLRRDFLKEYENGEIIVTEVKHNEFVIKRAIEPLMDLIATTKGSKIKIIRKGVSKIMDDQNTQAPATPEPTNEAPQAPSEQPATETVAETPAQPEAPATPTEPATPSEPSEPSTPAQGEEVPGQAPAVEKTQVPVPDVSTTGEKTE